MNMTTMDGSVTLNWLLCTPSIYVEKTAILDDRPPVGFNVGDLINYTVCAMNNGNATLENLTVNDIQDEFYDADFTIDGGQACSQTLSGDLDLGAQVCCSYYHPITQDEINQ
jgi:hypothetical protein